jgi:uncharacterized protein (DUF885 family)
VGTVTELSSRYVDEFAVLDPVRAARGMGVGLDDDTMTDYSPDGDAAMADLLRRTLAEVRAATPDGEPERLGAAYLGDLCESTLPLYDTGERQRLLNQLAGPQAAVRMLFDLMDRSTPEGWGHVRARLERVPAAMAGYRATLEAGMHAGRLSSARLAAAVAEQCETWAGGDGDGGWFGRFVEPAGDDAALRDAARGAARAYGELASWLRSTYAPAADAAGVGDGVGGERYRVWAQNLLGADLDPDDSYGWGCEELARIQAEQATECQRIRPGAGFEEVRDLLLTDPARAVHGLDAWRAWLQDVVDEATDALAGAHFDIPDPLRRCDVAIPPVGSAAAPYYTAPSEDLEVPGRVWFPSLGRESFPTWDDVTTAYHEAVPGHHLQVGGTRFFELTRAHRLGFQAAHGEGWALYAERLMDELGWFRTPDTRLGFLSSQAFRAVRVVIDVGLHTGREVPDGLPGAGQPWTFDLAVEALQRAGGLTAEFARSEILRYLSWPAQATCYKLGERSWLTGRDAARSAAGDAFDLRTWHARALALGPLGLDRLERELAGIG